MTHNNKPFIIFFSFLFVLLAALNSYFVVRQTEQAIVFQFRDVVRVVSEPGLHLKVPFFQTVQNFERRVLAVDAPSQEIMLAEQKPLEVDAFARYRITNPLLFFQRLKDERIANDRLGSMLNSTLRSVLGRVKLAVLLSSDRVSVMSDISKQLNNEAVDFGVEIIDVRIRRTDLPQKTSAAVFARMRSEREQEAAQIRAQGQQEAVQTTSDANRQATIILAEAQGEAEKIKGEGDRKALQVMAQATNKDPEFYGFWRSMQAYREGLKSHNTTYILNPEGEFFKYFDAKSNK
ncbi:MAG: protease modulator HflC [Proteobacteria bacterium]|jgi:membrane protease subunit HflC|nr:protease modulator HflC [Alphaproteobacteria bacterium]NCC02555.1 protease modulator HflC [Pseudomonadota bacterium]